GNGDGTFAAAGLLPVAVAPHALAADDFDGDAIADLVTTHNAQGPSNFVSVLRGNGDGTFRGVELLDAMAGGQAAVGAALNGAGAADFLTVNAPSNSVSVYISDGAGSFALAPTYDAGPAARGLAVADFSGDGVPDAATANETEGTVTLRI